MEFTTHLELHSQTTRLVGRPGAKHNTHPRGCHPFKRLVPEDLDVVAQGGPAASRLQLAGAIPKLSSCRFTRRY